MAGDVVRCLLRVSMVSWHYVVPSGGCGVAAGEGREFSLRRLS